MMEWSFDEVKDVLVCGVLSSTVSLPLLPLGFSCYSTAWIFVGLWIITSLFALKLSCIKVSPAGKAVVVTGCDHGIGHSLAIHLHHQGFRVFAGCLNEDSVGAQRLKNYQSDRLVVLRMDVTSRNQIDDAVQDVKKLLPHGEILWGLINNAGIMARGFVEWVPLNTYRRILEVNVLGMIAATKAFLPLIRQARGRVVNMSSVSGVMGTGMLSPYTITKYAVEGLTDCLRKEMRPWGVSVCAVQPSNFNAATQLVTAEEIRNQTDVMWSSMPQDVRDDYGKHFFDLTMSLHLESAHGGETDLTPVLSGITNALTQRFPRARYRVVDLYYFFKVAAAIHLPEKLYDLLYPPRQFVNPSIHHPS